MCKVSANFLAWFLHLHPHLVYWMLVLFLIYMCPFSCLVQHDVAAVESMGLEPDYTKF